MADWQQLRQRYGPLVWATAYRILANQADAADCFQDVFTEVLERSSPEDVRDWPAFLRWLTAKRALNRLRQQRSEAARHTHIADVTTLATNLPGPVEEAESNELVDRIRQEVARLPARQGEAFWLACVEQVSYVEIGQQLGLDANAVGVLMHRVRTRLRKVLSDLDPVKR
jgi:RNA polymerase sigma-70 factor (ECF subfamily)